MTKKDSLNDEQVNIIDDFLHKIEQPSEEIMNKYDQASHLLAGLDNLNQQNSVLTEERRLKTNKFLKQLNSTQDIPITEDVYKCSMSLAIDIIQTCKHQIHNLENVNGLLFSSIKNTVVLSTSLQESMSLTNKLPANLLANQAKEAALKSGKGGQNQKDKYKHITTISTQVIKTYMQTYPKRLTPSQCVRGVKSEIDGLIYDEMSKQSNYKAASLIARPSMKTIIKHRKIAFEMLKLDI